LIYLHIRLRAGRLWRPFFGAWNVRGTGGSPITSSPDIYRRCKQYDARLAIILVSLGVGIRRIPLPGAHVWLDSFVNRAMILSGMGPSSPLQTDIGQVFAAATRFQWTSLYYQSGVVFAPGSWFLHRFHWKRRRRTRKGAVNSFRKQQSP